MKQFLKNLWAAFVEARQMQAEHYTKARRGQ